jgi:hypothetical protein
MKIQGPGNSRSRYIVMALLHQTLSGPLVPGAMRSRGASADAPVLGTDGSREADVPL